MISFKNVKKEINKTLVLSSISFDIKDNDFFVINCENNGGKTTICKLLSKIIKPDSGEVIYKDIKPNDVTLIYDNNENNTRFTVYEYLNFYGVCRGIDEKEVNKRIDYYISKYKIDNLKYADFDDLNRSVKKVIYMICALIADTKVIILDEPYKHVFLKEKMIIKTIIDDLSVDKTVIATCDSLDDYVDIAKNVLVIDNGKINMYGDTKSVIEKYGYKNYLEICYDGDFEKISKLLHDMENVKEFTYTDNKIDIVTYNYGDDYEILEALINNNIKIKSFRREDKI